ncbi:hypothetical protein HZA42_02585 [Candidatus Peregrinibacteria bacterium]|nr:hypothetical protein [Candidatus Peregrinibacteria bacterium]
MNTLNRLAALSAAAVLATPNVAETKMNGDGQMGNVSHLKRPDVADQTRRAAQLVLSGNCDSMHTITKQTVGIPPSTLSRTVSGPFGGIGDDGLAKIVRMEALAAESGEPESLSVTGKVPAFSGSVKITDKDLNGTVDGVFRQEYAGKFGNLINKPIRRASSEAMADARDFFRDAVERALDRCSRR